MVKRKAIVGRRVDDLFGDHITATKEDGTWSAGRPSIIYFWASWSPESLAAGVALREAENNGTNVLGVCLDADIPAVRIAAREAGLPGRLIYVNRGLASSMATDLGVVDVPTVFLSNKQGVFTDVKALDDLSAKVQALLN